MYLGIVLCFVVFVTGVFSYSQEAASNATMDKFKDMLPQQVTVIRNGQDLEINASDLVVGDVVTVEMGANVAADVRMFEVTRHVSACVSRGTSEHSRLPTPCVQHV